MREQANQEGDTVTFNLAMSKIKSRSKRSSAFGEDLALGQIAVAGAQQSQHQNLAWLPRWVLSIKLAINKPILRCDFLYR